MIYQLVKLRLHIAAGKGHTQTINVLVGGGVKTEALSNYGKRALYIAAGKGLTEVVMVLLAGGA